MDLTFMGNLLSKVKEKHSDLIPKSEDENKNYRPFAKKVFEEMFKEAKAQIPNDAILEELITNCNQASYVGGTLYSTGGPLINIVQKHKLSAIHKDKIISLDCTNENSLEVKYSDKITLSNLCENGSPREICELSSSLEFTLDSQNNKDVTCRDGKLSFTAPKELENYKVGDKNLFDIIKEYFQSFCEKLGFKFEAKIEHHFGEPSQNGHLDNMEQPTEVGNSTFYQSR